MIPEPAVATTSSSGIVAHGGRLDTLRVRAPVRVEDGESWYQATPCDSLRLRVEIDFPHPLVNVMPSYLARFDDNDPSQRIVVLANYNNDLAEYWEWSATGMFPIGNTNEAYKLGVNYIIYAMTH